MKVPVLVPTVAATQVSGPDGRGCGTSQPVLCLRLLLGLSRFGRREGVRDFTEHQASRRVQVRRDVDDKGEDQTSRLLLVHQIRVAVKLCQSLKIGLPVRHVKDELSLFLSLFRSIVNVAKCVKRLGEKFFKRKFFYVGGSASTTGTNPSSRSSALARLNAMRLCPPCSSQRK
jgi:hypothetical protein